MLAAFDVLTNSFATKTPYSEFEVNDFYFYEDDNKRGYINSNNKPNPPPIQNDDGSETLMVSLKFGLTPEDVRISFLRLEQEKFFRECAPKIYSRFQK